MSTVAYQFGLRMSNLVVATNWKVMCRWKNVRYVETWVWVLFFGDIPWTKFILSNFAHHFEINPALTFHNYFVLDRLSSYGIWKEFLKNQRASKSVIEQPMWAQRPFLHGHPNMFHFNENKHLWCSCKGSIGVATVDWSEHPHTSSQHNANMTTSDFNLFLCIIIISILHNSCVYA